MTIPQAAKIQIPPMDEYEDEFATPTKTTPKCQKLNDLAARLWAEYRYALANTNSLLTGNTKAFYNAKDAKIWKQLAAALIEHGWDDAADFIQAQFRYSIPLGPFELLNNCRFNWYRDYTERRVSQLKIALRSERMLLIGAMADIGRLLPRHTETQLLQRVLRDLSVPLSPLFRYCTARQLGLNDVAELFSDAAWQQFSNDRRGYSRAWQELLPFDFLNRNTDDALRRP